MIEIVYFGTSNHAVLLLEEVLKRQELVLKLVVTKPDTLVGRKQLLTPSPVKVWCQKNNIPFITPSNLKTELSSVLETLKTYQTDIALVADYGLMIPKELLSFYKHGIVNIHFSLLPKLRGASPVAYTLLNGDTKTGISFIKTEVKMDTGGILAQIPYTITQPETDETLYQKLFVLAGEHVGKVLTDYVNGALSPTAQDETQATYCTPSGKFDRSTYLTKEDAKLDLTKPAEHLERAVRAYYPWPVAWTTLGELASYLQKKLRNNSETAYRVKLHKAHLSEGKFIIDELQPEGSKKMSFISFENGYLTA